jgi:hypothetical protein
MPEPTTPELRRLPGAARPRAEVLWEYENEVRERRGNLPIDMRILGDLFFPGPEKLYRWRIQLDCGCITETLTYGDQKVPADNQWTDGHGRRLPAGQVICVQHDEDRPAPYREIVKWGTSKLREFEADPVEPEDWCDDQELWLKIRREEPTTSAFWTVTLSCGHQDEVCVGDVDWKPGDEPHRVSPERQAEIRGESEEYYASHPAQTERDRQERDHDQRYVDLACPRPDPEHQCYSCRWARSIVAYQRVGWLMPTPKPTAPPTPEQVAEKATKEAQRRARRIEKLEAELAKLRAEEDG